MSTAKEAGALQTRIPRQAPFKAHAFAAHCIAQPQAHLPRWCWSPGLPPAGQPQ